MNKIVISLDNGYKLVAEQNDDSAFSKELFVYIETESGMCWQDLVIARPIYKLEDDVVKYSSDKFEVLVYGNYHYDDITDKFIIPMVPEDCD